MSNGYALFSSESTWGTIPASGYRALEVNTDGHKTSQETLQHRGLRAASAAPRASGRRIQKRKGTGSIEVPGFSNGLGILFRAAASTAASAVKVGGTLAFEQVYTWTGAGPPTNRSITAELYRDRASGTYDAFTYSGGRCTQLSIGQDLAGFLQFTFAMDYKAVTRQGSLPSRTPVDVEPDLIYSWEDARITLTPDGGSDSIECISSFSVDLPNELNVDKWCLNRGTTRHQPMRQNMPVPTGTLTWDYEDPEYYDAFVDGTTYSLTADWLGSDVIEGSTYPGLTIELGTIKFSGDDPESPLDGPTTQAMPFEVLQNDDNDPVCTITFVTSDTTY